MSIFDRKNGQTPLAAFVSKFATEYKSRGSEFSSEDIAKHSLSLESLNDGQLGELDRYASDMQREISDALVEAKVVGDTASLESFQLDAGVVIAAASGNPGEYHSRATNLTVSNEGADSVVAPEANGVWGSLSFSDVVSVESFDDQPLDKHVPYSIAFNVQASRQDEFGEAFYPTTVITPDQAGLDLVIDRTLVMGEQRHNSSGKVAGWNRRSILDGIQDVTLLDNNAVKLVPAVAEDDSNADAFVADALVAPREVSVNKVAVTTAPLKMGKEVDLLGISEHPGLIGAGLMDSTDSIDARIGLANLYLNVTGEESDGSGGTNTVNEVYRFPVSRMPRADFVKSVEGDHREMNLVFNTRDLPLDGSSKTVAGAASSLLQVLADENLRVRLKVSVNGTANLETAALGLHTTPVEIAGVYQYDAGADSWTELPLDGTLATQVKNAITSMEVVGYDLNATRSNQNLRTRGLLLNVNRRTERYTIPMGSPISVPAPIGSDRSASDLTALVTAARIRTSNNAVTSLLNYAETLKQYVENLPTYDEDGLAIEGIGRYLVNPFYEFLELDLEQELNSISSHERNFDVKALIIDAIREIAYRAYRDTNYQAAIDAMTGTAGQKPVLVIGTDRTIANHLQITGDSRTAGIDFEHRIVSSDDKRMFGKIVFSFVRPNAQGGDPLSFGTHAWIPELTSTVQLTRQGATVKETTVQPRSRHVNCLPILGEIDVKGLEILRRRVQSDATVSP